MSPQQPGRTPKQRWFAPLRKALAVRKRPADAARVEAAIELQAIHLANAKLLPSRYHLLRELAQGGNVAEIGVAFGDFSGNILTTLAPTRFVAIDLFGLHELPTVWGRDTEQIFGGKTHEQFYRDRFAEQIREGIVTVERGASHEVIARFPDGHFDMIYVDAAHDYESVCRDLAASAPKVARDGVLVMNDYTMFDPLLLEPYGVVHATNEFCRRENWELIYFALQPHMFCDVALRRR